ncbi:MAG: von Willebrand factor type A domain-containing protein [Verrucomicrobia bacterium]|nr:von Willebrand factor type A domain-containing protein [Verrucomicrobiota bacterium]
MKTKLATLSVVSLLLCTCGDKASTSTESSGPSGTRGGVLLTTELPPELIEGTPRPIMLPPNTPMSNARPPRPLANPNPAPPPLLPPLAQDPRHEQPPGGFLIPGPQPPPVDRERYGELIDNPWQTPVDAPLSTFSIDVDTASYANVRSMILDGRSIPTDAVRLEEMVNYFDYSYSQPTDNHPFAIHVTNATCPWNPEHQLVRVALKGLEIERTERSPANLVFLLDVSGSMNDPRKLPLVTASLELLLEELNASDTLSIIVYAGAEGLALPPTACDTQGRERIIAALRSFRAGGTTNGGAGIKLAYQIARDQFKPGGINRVILATDGDFNVGVTGDGALVRMVAENAKSNVCLTVLGVGSGNLNDGMLEAITNKGNGVYYYLDSLEEARRVFLQKLMGTLVTIAKDVKIQVEFNPARVRGYRLLGYANRMLRKEDFSNDRIDAGDIGAGHTVTAFYEIETGDARNLPPAEALRYAPPQEPSPADPSAAAAPPASREWLTVKLRYKQPEGACSTLIERPFTGVSREFGETDADFRFGTSVAMAAMILREDEGLPATRFEDAGMLAAAALGPDPHGCRTEFVSLLKRLAARPH